MSIGSKVPQNKMNTSRYAVSFITKEDIEVADVIENIQSFGTIKDLTWKTIEGTAIKTGQYTAYLELNRR